MEAFNSRLDSFAKARRVKQSNTKRILSLKWPHPDHFIATPDTLTEAGFFFNPSWDARDNVECFFCGKCLDGWEEQDDPLAIHWDKCRDYCAWAVVRCGLSDDVDRKGKCVSPSIRCLEIPSNHSLIVSSSKILADNPMGNQWRRRVWRPSD
jgi:baculoviral IAP repeat-containing protein 5